MTAAGDVLANMIGFRQNNDAYNFAGMVGISTLLGVVATQFGAPLIYTSLAGQFAESTGWPLYSVLLAQIPSWAFAIFPYQMATLPVAMAMGKVSVRQTVRFLLVFFVLGFSVVIPLYYAWLKISGFIP